MEALSLGGATSSDSVLKPSLSPRPATFSALTLTPSEVEWLKQDSRRAADLFARMAEGDERLSAAIDAARAASTAA